LLSLDTGSEVQFYHHDALGSTVNLTKDDGTVKVSYWIDPYGQIRKQEGESVNRQVFTGQEFDENTGLVYFGARYYDPDTARFITQDSYLGESGTPPSLHRYLYAYSNPTVYVDLYGYESVIPHIDGEKPLDAAMWKAGEFTDNASNFADDLTNDEEAYLAYFNKDRVDPNNLSEKQQGRAKELFGDAKDANESFANWKDRANIVKHYAWTHPATVNSMMGLYRLSRDVNPITFSYERGWQVTSGKELFTGETVSRARAGAEFFAAIALIKANNMALAKAKLKVTKASNGGSKDFELDNNILSGLAKGDSNSFPVRQFMFNNRKANFSVNKSTRKEFLEKFSKKQLKQLQKDFKIKINRKSSFDELSETGKKLQDAFVKPKPSRVLDTKDSRVAASAYTNRKTVVTSDLKFYKRMVDMGIETKYVGSGKTLNKAINYKPQKIKIE